MFDRAAVLVGVLLALALGACTPQTDEAGQSPEVTSPAALPQQAEQAPPRRDIPVSENLQTDNEQDSEARQRPARLHPDGHARLRYAGAEHRPRAPWGSRLGGRLRLRGSRPAQADDAGDRVQFRVDGQALHRHGDHEARRGRRARPRRADQRLPALCGAQSPGRARHYRARSVDPPPGPVRGCGAQPVPAAPAAARGDRGGVRPRPRAHVRRRRPAPLVCRGGRDVHVLEPRHGDARGSSSRKTTRRGFRFRNMSRST